MDNADESDQQDIRFQLPLPNPSDEWTVYGVKWCPYTKIAIEFITQNLKADLVYHECDNRTELFSGFPINGYPAIFHHTKLISSKELETYTQKVDQ